MAVRKTGINPKGFDKSQIKLYLILLPFAAFMILPLIFIINHAFKPMQELFAFPPTFFVKQPSLENFQNLVKTAQTSAIPISRYIFNSVVVTVVVIAFSLLFSSMAAYALSKKQFRGKTFGLELNNAALMFVATAVTIPRYLIINGVHIQNTYWAHILPLLALPVSVFLLKQFIDQVPDSLIEAAIIDGAGEFRIYWSVVMPLIRPALATSALLVFQSVWNNLETSQLFVTNESLRTLAFYLNTFASNTNTVVGQGAAAAASLIIFVPNLLLFVFMQSKVINTMAHSGLK